MFRNNLESAIPKMSEKDRETFTDIHNAIRNNLNDEQRQDALESVYERNNPINLLMLLSTEELWNEVQEIASDRQWTMDDTRYLTIIFRFYLNPEIALIKKSNYGPAISRAKIINSSNNIFLNYLKKIILKPDKDINFTELQSFDPTPLHFPSILESLITNSKGELDGFMNEISVFRNKAKPLRKNLSKKIRLRSNTFEPQYNNNDIDTLKSIQMELRRNIKLSENKNLNPAFTIHFSIIPPFISASSNVDVSLKKRSPLLKRKVNVLSELVKGTTGYDIDRHAYRRLLRNTGYSN